MTITSRGTVEEPRSVLSVYTDSSKAQLLADWEMPPADTKLVAHPPLDASGTATALPAGCGASIQWNDPPDLRDVDGHMHASNSLHAKFIN